jgi:hypothetical protein
MQHTRTLHPSHGRKRARACPPSNLEHPSTSQLDAATKIRVPPVCVGAVVTMKHQLENSDESDDTYSRNHLTWRPV